MKNNYHSVYYDMSECYRKYTIELYYTIDMILCSIVNFFWETDNLNICLEMRRTFIFDIGQSPGYTHCMTSSSQTKMISKGSKFIKLFSLKSMIFPTKMERAAVYYPDCLFIFEIWNKIEILFFIYHFFLLNTISLL